MDVSYMYSMVPTLKDYLPGNAVLLCVVIFLLFVAAMGCVVFLIALYRVVKCGIDLRKCNEFNTLTDWLNKTSEEKRAGNEHEIFKNFALVKKLDSKSPIAKHLAVIWRAGWDGTRLEVDTLINNTSHNIFRYNQFLKSILSSFIIIGLMGTLLGLSISLHQIAPALNCQAKSDPMVLASLQNLFGNLKGAFTPSLIGVLFTIIGILSYGLYLHLFCAPVRLELERLTVTEWVPRLYQVETSRFLKATEENMDSVRKVAKLADSVQNDILQFHENMTATTGIVAHLQNSVSSLNTSTININEFSTSLKDFSHNFSVDVSKLTSFQYEISQLYKQMQGDSQTFQETIKKTVSLQNDQTKKILDTINATSKSLKIYEEAYVKERGKIDSEIKDFISIARTGFENLSDNNNQRHSELVANQKEGIESLNDVTIKSLNEIKTSLDINLQNLNSQLNMLDAPMREAANTIQSSFQNFCNYMNKKMDSMNAIVEEIKDTNGIPLIQTDNIGTNDFGKLIEEFGHLQKNIVDHKTDNTSTNDIGKLIEELGQLRKSIAVHTDKNSELVAKMGQIMEKMVSMPVNKPASLKEGPVIIPTRPELRNPQPPMVKPPERPQDGANGGKPKSGPINKGNGVGVKSTISRIKENIVRIFS